MTQMDANLQATYEKLKVLRTRPNMSMKPTPLLRKTFIDRHGREKPLKLRDYQVQMVFQLLGMKRFVVGDDTGLGKTIEVIAALCYLFALKPNQKVIVLAKKNSVLQWEREFAKFTTGIRVLVCKGTPKQREKARKKYESSTGPTVLIAGYRSMVRDFTAIQEWRGYVLVADECFQYHTPVTLADGTTELIGKIVSERMPVEVLSRNPETGQVEPRRVTHWHRNPLHKGRRKNLVHLNFRFGGKVRVTRTHKFHTPEGRELPAGKLRKGAEVQHLCANIPSESQWQVILGGLLGDSSILHPDRPGWGVCFGHSAKQEQYLQFKREMLAPLGVSEVSEDRNGYQPVDGSEKVPVLRFRLGANAAITSFLVGARVRRGGKKRVTLDWLDRIGPLGLAVWYGDDGSLSEHTCADGTVTKRITLHTQDFSREEVELLAGWLRWKWGLNAQVKTTKPRSDRPEGLRRAYPYLYLANEAAERFLDLLPCGFPGVMYKFPGKPIATLTSFSLTPERGLVTDWVTEKRVWTPPDPDKDRYVYNLEVEGNHNYFANGTLVSNCTVFKNPSTQIHQICRYMGQVADRVWGLTATLIKNHLVEGYGIFKVVQPSLFTHSPTGFQQDYCILRMQRIKGNRQIPIIVGYRPRDIKRFRLKIDPFYLGRPKHEVAKELPVLTIRDIKVGMTKFQHEKYQEALAGLLELGSGEEKETSPLTAIIYCQEIVDHPCLLGFDDQGSQKMDALVDLITDGGEFEGQKIIIYTRFRRLVDFAIAHLKKKGVKCVRVTGSENEEQRQEAMDTFQDPDSDANVIWITAAGGDAINLQAAKALIFYDTPWSAGDYIQILGRMIRIGSEHDRVYALHLLAEASIDGRVQKVLKKKMELVEAILGKRIKGEDDDPEDVETMFAVESELTELFEGLKEDAVKAV